MARSLLIPLSFVVFYFLLEGCLGITCPPSPAATQPNQRLKETILCDYDRHSRPVKNISESVEVNVHFKLVRLDMDEHNEGMSVSGIMHLVWADYHLKWKPEDYSQIKFVVLDSSDIWMPDLTVNRLDLNGFERLTQSSCIAINSGWVSCTTKVHIRAPCTQDMRHWPFDQHNCTFYLSSFVYWEHELRMRPSNPPYESGNRAWDLAEWSIQGSSINLTTSPGNMTPYGRLQFNFLVNRHPGTFAACTVYPAFALLVLVLSTFWMGTMILARVNICASVLLSCVYFLNYLLFVIPPNGINVPVLIVIFRDCLSLTVFALGVAVAVKAMAVSTGEPPLWLRSLSDRIELSVAGRVLFLTSPPSTRDDEAAIIEPTKSTSVWAPCALLLDRAAFIVSLVVCLILTMGYLP